MKLGCSYFGNRIMRHVAEDMKYLADKHFTYVVHTFSENDFHFYGRTMKDIVRISKECGLETYLDPWGVGKVFGGEAFSEFVCTHPQVRQIISDGLPAGIACLNNPEFRQFIHEWIDAAVETDTDYVFWDEPHFYIPTWMGGRPNTWGCLCQHCRKKFEERYNAPLPEIETSEVKEFKHQSILDFLTEMIGYTHKLSKKNALCILPHSTGQGDNWIDFASISELDIFGTDPYWYASGKDVKEYMGEFAREVAKTCRQTGREGQIWIQGFKVPAGREEEIRTAVEVAVNAGIRNLAVWGFEACAHISWVAPDDPAKAWSIICDAFASVKNIDEL